MSDNIEFFSIFVLDLSLSNAFGKL